MILKGLTVLLFLSTLSCVMSSPKPVTQVPNFTKLSDDEIRHLQNRGFGPTVASHLSTLQDEDIEDSSVASSQQQRSVTYADDYYSNPNVIPVRQVKVPLREQPIAQTARPNYPLHYQPQQQQPQQQQQRYRQQQQPSRVSSASPQSLQKTEEELEEEKEIEEPDRLSLLLPQSKFDCISKNTGYYADEELGCEVFHYCQDNAKHSWICPEGFTFHQVHLICMPPGADNICEKSSQYHFVNEYLYKPINLEEYQQKPNISLKYSDRYYPESYYENNYDEEEQVNHHRTSVRVRDPESQRSVQVARTTFRPETTLGQVFRTSNEVNIPLQQRRPQYATQRYL